MSYRTIRLVVAGLVACSATLFAACSDLLTDGYDYGEIEVRTVRRSGEPVPGLDLALYGRGRDLGYGTTGDSGRFVFRYVPQGRYGVYVGISEAYRLLAGPEANVVDTIRIQPGERQEVTFTFLKVGSGTLAAQVSLETGEPAAGVRVRVYSFRGTAAEGVTTAQGRVEFPDLPFGNYGIEVQPAPGFSPAPGTLGYIDGLWVEEGSYETARFTLSKCFGAVRARIVDQTGRAASGVAVRLYTFRGTLARGATDAGGEFLFSNLPCGDYGLALELPLGSSVPNGRDYVDGIQVLAGLEVPVRFDVSRCQGVVRVRVVDPEGAPVPGATVSLYTFRGVVERKQTDARGSVEFSSVGCFDQYGAAVDPPAGYSVEERRGSKFQDGIAVTEGSDVQITFAVSRP